MNSIFSGQGSVAERKYRLTQLRHLSPIARSINFSEMTPGEFGAIEGPALREARDNARHCGQLFASSSRDDGGRKVTTFEGDIDSWLKHFKSPGYTATINSNLANENRAQAEQQAFEQWSAQNGK